jgi:type IV pilus assembly protein PilV
MPIPLTRQPQRGSSLVEVLMAMLLMSFGVLAMTTMQANAIQHSHTIDTRARATLLAHDLADRMRANVAPSNDWSAYELSSHAPLSAPNAALLHACQGGTPCAFADMAAVDLGQWQQQLADSLPEGRGHVHLVGMQADIWVIWDEAEQTSGQAHDACPSQMNLGKLTRCLYLRMAL